jgi:hypothetical protein
VGLYLRKSIRVGPFRFNLSGSGIGVSCGIPGLRLGVGPRGNYIHAGRGGIYYRKTFSDGGHGRQQSLTYVPTAQPELSEQPIDPTLSNFESVDTGISLEVQDASSKDLLDELNDKRSKQRLAPWVVLAAIAACAIFYANDFSMSEFVIVGALCVPVIGAAFFRDLIKKTSVLLYDLDSSIELAYAELTTGFERAASCDRIWHISAEASVLDRKYHAGASRVQDTDKPSLAKVPPPLIKTNIQPPAIRTAKRSIYFFPDRALILDAAGFGAITYRDLKLQDETSTFITGETIAPNDARVVSYTWRYVNKSGGPDHRFANNPQLPVIETRDASLTSNSGFNITLKFSNTAAAEELVSSLRAFASKQSAAVLGANGEHLPLSVTDMEKAQAHSPSRPMSLVVLTTLCLLGIVTVIFFHAAKSRPAVGVSSKSADAHALQNVPNPAVPMPQPRSVQPSTPPSSTRIATAMSASPSAEFVTLSHPTRIMTPSGRITLTPGMRLPLARISGDSVIVHYFDGRDYKIPRSAVERP